MKVILGLGNPGSKYQNTRHNIGFWVVDALTTHLGLPPHQLEKNFTFMKTKIAGQEVLLAKPLTFMNESGKAAQAILTRLLPKHSTAENFLVVQDEIDLPLGQLRFKKGGGNAGHRGLESLTEAIGNEYYRCRVGVGRPDGIKEAAHHVLEPFTGNEKAQIQRITKNTCLAIKDYLTLSFKQVQNRWHAADLLVDKGPSKIVITNQ